MISRTVTIMWVGGFAALLAGCGGSSGDKEATLPQLSAAAPGTLTACASLAKGFNFANTTISSAAIVPAGAVAGSVVGEHCLVQGEMYRRNGVNGSYAIGFEMRMPTAWNGRFLYQGNGGADGVIVPATASQGNSPSTPSGLSMGFAVLSSDAGHNSSQNIGGPNYFSLDPQARLDYGYQAVGKLTPMARELVKAAYGRQPDRMYMAGCSNGGRHGMVAAARYADQYDGIVAGDPGFNLPKAAVEVAWDTQQLTRIATPGAVNPLTGGLDLGSGFTAQERTLVASKIVAKCDALDGATDGMVLDVKACQAAFNLQNDVPTCTGTRDGTCLTADQKSAVANIFAGARNSAGTPLYSSYPLDPGVGSSGWAIWKTYINIALGGASTPYIFTTPPVQVAPADYQSFLTNYSMDTDAPKIFATGGAFMESAMQFMTPPNPENLSVLRGRGAKLIVYHGTGDPIFSFNDTASWYSGLQSSNSKDTQQFARLFPVPGMNHCSGGPSTDQFDMLSPIVNWVEKGVAPDSVKASVNSTNTDLPSNWSKVRSRPLCAYPEVARYKGSGDPESADSFTCSPA